MIPTTIPHGRTARRLEWAHLPPHIRALVERRCGSPVVGAQSQGAGFTPGFASVLTCADGSRHFVKAASTKAQRMFAASYREEARKLAALPPGVPAPRLRWVHDADDWVVLGIEYVDARPPVRPWTRADLDAALDLTAALAATLTPAPPALAEDTIVGEFVDWPRYWDDVREIGWDIPGLDEHIDEAATLAAGYADAVTGETLVHTDIRDDNILITDDGRALLCDWNWPAVGADWLDTVFLMIGPRGDGLDVETVLAESSLTKAVPPEHIDAVIAVVTGYFLKSAGDPVPPTSPYIRRAQVWQGQVCWQWLAERRGWL